MIKAINHKNRLSRFEHRVQFFVDDHPHSWQDYVDANVCVGTSDWPWTRGMAKEMNLRMFKMFKDWESLSSFLVVGVKAIQMIEGMRQWPKM